MNIFDRIGLSIKAKSQLRPYFSKQRNFRLLEIFDTNIDPKITAVYQELLHYPDLWKQEKEAYQSFVDKVNEHNDEVSYILGVIDAWNYSDFLDNPRKYDEEEIQEYIDVFNLIKKSYEINKKVARFIDEVGDIAKNYEQIISQFDIFNEYQKLLSFDDCEFIDHENEALLQKRVSDLLDKTKSFSFLYYSFNEHENFAKLVKEHNEHFINAQSKLPLFDDINNRSLDKEQRRSVLTDEHSVLVVAGAGSGKTLTICGKVKYLLENKKVNPNDILLLSYSKKSADDLQTKISKINKDLTVGTFHKIGLEILKETKNKSFMVQDQYNAIIEQYFREEIQKRPHMLQKVLEYYSLFINSFSNDKKYSNKGALYEDLKKSDFDTLRSRLLSFTNDINARETIKKEIVKSYEEMAIANWYFINGIDYVYESPYEHDVSTVEKRQYTPDFKLKNFPVYHEHYGIDKNGQASQYEAQEGYMYVTGMQWKKLIHQSYKTDCIETYSYEFEDGTIFEKLENELKKRGIQLHPLKDEQIYNALNSVYQSRPFRSFINVVRTFLSLYKATYRDDKQFEIFKNSTFGNKFIEKRTCIFLDIVKDIYHFYKEWLLKEGKIDFDDMILESAEELDKTDSFKFKYIIVDEFQDISFSRMRFLKKLISQGDARLFAVGDDWQAIYRFAGSDLNIFLNFDQYFGDSAITKITTTHRNSQELQDIVGPFIKRNPEQFNKTIHSDIHLDNPIQIIYFTDEKHDAFIRSLEEISKKDPTASVLILGRNSKDFEDISMDDRIFIDHTQTNESKTSVKCRMYPKLKLSFSTVHASKGLEEDYVILINADDATIGFPNKMEDDQVLDLVLSSKNKFLYAEERRLWYVALTRARKYTYILCDASRPSVFIEEIKEKCLALNQPTTAEKGATSISCPVCRTGHLVLRKNDKDGNMFYGCSNYPYCRYTINDLLAVKRHKMCPECGDFMVYKTGKNGSFYGCNNYPRCNHTEKYHKN